jgi:hypothetical protein
MKKLTFAISAVLMASCGSDSNKGAAPAVKPIVEPIQAAQTLTKDQVLNLANDYVNRNAHVVYVGETATSSETTPYMSSDQDGNVKNCIETSTSKKVVYSVSDHNIEIYVEKEAQEDCGDEVTGSFERFIEVHDTDEYYDMGISNDDIAKLQNAVFQKGLYKGQPVITVKSNGVSDDVTYDSYSIFALNRSMLTNEMLLRVRYSYEGKTFFTESSHEMADDTDISTIDLNGVYRRHISYED